MGHSFLYGRGLLSVGRMSAYFGCFIVVLQFVFALSPAGTELVSAQLARNSQDQPRIQEKPHSNHNPQHGGVFFMALDNQHHLEGVLLEPGIFKVYLYDAFTKPLSAADVQQASGSVQVGDSENAPRIPLAMGKDGRTLEAAIKELKLPVTITLWLRFRNSNQQVKPEVFTFPFSHYIAPDAHP
jgi:hypothetical protein